MPLLLILVLLISLPGPSWAQATGGSGIYENGNFILGVNPKDDVVTGHFENCVGFDDRTQKPLICCIFSLYGLREGDHYRITTWYPGDGTVIGGELRLPEPGITDLFIRLKASPPGKMAQNFDIEKGNYFPQDSSGSWLEVRVVSAPKAYFHREPDPKTKRAAYVIKNDVVRVYEKRNHWILGEYQHTRGWLREDHLFSIYPPKK